MIKFLMNLFRPKKVVRNNIISAIKHDEETMVFIDREQGIMRIETTRDLNQEEIMDICEEYYEQGFNLK